MVGKKYKLVQLGFNTLFNIQALKNFNDVKEGDIGGFVNSERNLDQTGNCWIYSGSVVDDSIISGNAKIYNSHIWCNSIVKGNSYVKGIPRVKNSYIDNNCTLIGGFSLSRSKITNDTTIILPSIEDKDGIVLLDITGLVLSSGCWNNVDRIADDFYLTSPTLNRVKLDSLIFRKIL